jgi:hypothetical protein
VKKRRANSTTKEIDYGRFFCGVYVRVCVCVGVEERALLCKLNRSRDWQGLIGSREQGAGKEKKRS